jgi:serpin B
MTGFSRFLALAIAVFLSGCTAGAPATLSPGSSSSSAPATNGPVASPSGAPSAEPSGALPSESVPAASGEPGGIVLAISDAPRAEASLEDAKAAAAAINAFGFDLYGRVAEPGANAVISPASIVIALGMARAGARGQTATEMDEVLHDAAADGNEAWLNGLDRALATRTKEFEGYGDEPQQVTLRIANTQFAQQGMHLEQDFLDALAARYGAGLNLVDYARDPDAARRLINAWVADQTEERIPELLGPSDVTEATRLTLVNAIYLKAAWLFPFRADDTEDETFTRSDGSTVDVPMMRIVSEALHPTFHAAAADEWQAIELPYVGGELSMLVVIPEDVDAFEDGLDPDRIAEIDESLDETPVDLSFPKFGIETRADLADMLGALGMPRAFTPGEGDFSGITGDRSLFIARVVHQANIDVDEIGTEAAAATAVGFDTAGPGESPPEPLVIRADRPFLFALRDVPTGAILFLGRVADPSIER